MQKLRAIIEQANRPTISLAFPDGTRALVLPESGRVLGLYPPDGEVNYFWTHPALATPSTALSFFARPGWINPGGDRTWLAPEIELFIGDLAHPEATYAVPAALDPGHWEVTTPQAEELHLTSVMRLRLHRTECDVSVHLTKRISPASNPVQHTSLASTDLQYAGYTLVTTLEVEAKPIPPVRLGIWNLMQLPQPGVMLIPIRERLHPQRVFGTLAADELTVGPHLLRWSMASHGENAKIALRARPLSGRAGYLRPSTVSDAWDLVVRQFSVDPVGDYADALWDQPRETGWVFQACCIRAGEERFNGLEYHTPAATSAVGAIVRYDTSQVWAFRGPAGVVANIACGLLGASDIIIPTDDWQQHYQDAFTMRSQHHADCLQDESSCALIMTSGNTVDQSRLT
jgi:hypothetical protein